MYGGHSLCGLEPSWPLNLGFLEVFRGPRRYRPSMEGFLSEFEVSATGKLEMGHWTFCSENRTRNYVGSNNYIVLEGTRYHLQGKAIKYLV